MSDFHRAHGWFGVALLGGAFAACGVEASAVMPAAVVDPEPQQLGGATTISDTTSNAYAFAARNLDNDGRNAFALGSHFFNQGWVTAPASAAGNDGLGPLYNATSCSSCHAKAGRGAPPSVDGAAFLGLVIRLSAPGVGTHGGPAPEPNYGLQFQQQGILGVQSEGNVRVEYKEQPGTFASGEAYSLRAPTYVFDGLNFGAFPAGTMSSPRISRAMVGLGLLQAVDASVVRSLADEADSNRDGISGRANEVWNEREKKSALGRFGWKASQPTVEQQVQEAFLADMGITTAPMPEENCTKVQTACMSAPSGGTETEPELSEQKRVAIVRWNMTLAVPARRNWKDATVARGETLFHQAGCIGCHLPQLKTAVLEGYPALSNQTIRPYTDLLLHDMGRDLADGRPDYSASGQEWRTPPLWGIGLLKTVNKHQFLLHDGRARGFAEAILWHGGEASGPREKFYNMSAADREALLAFLADL